MAFLVSLSLTLVSSIILKGGLEGSEGVRFEESGQVNRHLSEEKKDELKTITFGEEHNLEVPKGFPFKLKDPCSFPIPYMIGNVSIIRALCALGSSVSLMPYTISRSLT